MADQNIEQKFQSFKKRVEPENFNNIDFLTKKSNELMEEDRELAKRILVRVRNLQKQSTIQTSNKGLNNGEEGQLSDTPSVDSKELKKSLYKDMVKDWACSHPFIVIVAIPILIFSIYQSLIATERFDSQAQVIVQQPDGLATMDASMALLTGLGVSNSGVSDTELVKAYIYSNDMLKYLNQNIGLREHYSLGHIDYFSRLHDSDTQEDFIEYYKNHVEVYIDKKSSVVNINAQAFTPIFAQLLTKTIVERAEWYINSIGHQLAEAQLEFIKGEHQLVEDKLEQTQSKLLQFQQHYNLLDPTAEGMAMQQIAYSLEGQISIAEAELKGIKAIMSPNAPQVATLENKLRALRQQLANERNKLSQDNEKSIPVSEILARYTNLKIKMELALQAYTSSQVSLEKSRIEAYRKLKYLVVVESATLPENNKYPEVIYNISLFSIILSMVFAVLRVVLLIFKELK